MTYDARFYDAIRDGCRRSAEAVAPIVNAEYFTEAYIPRRADHVVDVGCGEGWWGRQFAGLGAVVQGYDTGAVPDAQIDVAVCDLTGPIPDRGGHDLAICLEVAEHLPETAAAHLVAELVRLAPTVLFSAAMPRQGGTGHVNCQPPAYWADLFAQHGYGCDDELRFKVWDNPAVEPWYKSNLLVFDSTIPHTTPRHVIHPDLWLEPR